MSLNMNCHIESLFELTRSRVSEQHIADFSPCDPGYESYVRLWTRIFHTGEIPRVSEFALSEVIDLTGFSSPNYFNDQNRFRHYRRFTSAVAAALIGFGNDSVCVRVGSYLARDLIVDLDISDTDHFEAVRHVFPVLRDLLLQQMEDDQYPYFTLGSLILAQMAGDFEESESFAAQLLKDEAASRNDQQIEDARFLFGLTNYDQFNADWMRYILDLKNPNNSHNLKLVMDAFSDFAA